MEYLLFVMIYSIPSPHLNTLVTTILFCFRNQFQAMFSFASLPTSFILDSLSLTSSGNLPVLTIDPFLSWLSSESKGESWSIRILLFCVQTSLTFMIINAVKRGTGVMMAAATGITAETRMQWHVSYTEKSKPFIIHYQF